MADINLAITLSFGFSNTTEGATDIISSEQIVPSQITPAVSNAIVNAPLFGFAFLPGGDVGEVILSTSSLGSRFSDAVNLAIAIQEDFQFDKSVMYYAELDDTITLSELGMFDGIASNDYIDDPVPISDQVDVGNINYSIEIDDTISVVQDPFDALLLNDQVLIYDSVVTQQFFAEAQKIITGTQFYTSSEHLSPSTFIHVFKRYSHPIMVDFTGVTDTVELIQSRGGSVIFDQIYDGGSVPVGPEPEPRFLPNGNLPNNYALSDANGQFVIQGLSLGVYVLASVKKGYTLGWKKIDLKTDTAKIDLYLAPINSWNYVERVYNILGHSFKMYHVSNYIDPVDGNRVVDGLLIFGDIYAEGDPSGTPIISDGELVMDTTYNPGQIILMPLPDLGYNGFFVPENGERVTQNPEATQISWVTNVSARIIKGFGFRLRALPDRTIVLNLSIATGGIRMPYGDGAIAGGSGGSGGGGGAGGGGGGSSGSPSYSSSGTPWPDYPPAQPRGPNGAAAPYDPPPWDPAFYLNLSDGFAIGETAMDADVIHAGQHTRLLLLTDMMQIDEDWGTGVPLSLIGIALDSLGVPVVGATVHAVALRNGVIAGSTTSDDKGLWRITNLQSELDYRITVSAPLLGLLSVSGTVSFSDQDIIDERAWVYLEGEALSQRGPFEFFDARIILPPMFLRTLTDVRIWGEVFDATTDVSIAGVLVEAYPGNLTEDQLLQFESQVHSDVTGTRSLFVDGYYEIYLPKGDWTIRARKNQYVKSQLYHITVQAGYQLDIPIVPIVVSGTVFDKEVFDAIGEIQPIAGAVISTGQYSAVSGADGTFNLELPFEQNIPYTVTCAATRYQSLVKTLIATSTMVTGFNFAMYPVIMYPDPTGGGS